LNLLNPTPLILCPPDPNKDIFSYDSTTKKKNIFVLIFAQAPPPPSPRPRLDQQRKKVALTARNNSKQMKHYIFCLFKISSKNTTRFFDHHRNAPTTATNLFGLE
jgi:hypothetical protein